MQQGPRTPHELDCIQRFCNEAYLSKYAPEPHYPLLHVADVIYTTQFHIRNVKHNSATRLTFQPMVELSCMVFGAHEPPILLHPPRAEAKLSSDNKLHMHLTYKQKVVKQDVGTTCYV